MFSRVLYFCHFALAFLFSPIFSSISCGIIFVCLLVSPGVVVVLAAYWIVLVNVVTTYSMCSGVFSGMLRCLWIAIKYWFVSVFNYYGCMIGAKLEVGYFF